MPALPFSQVTVEPETIYAAANQPTPLHLHLSNVGNASASFPLTVTVPVTSWLVSTLQSPVSLSPNQTNSQNATLTIPGGPLGATYPLLVSSSAPGSAYVQTAVANVQIVGAFGSPIFIASGAAQVVRVEGVALPAAVESLAQSVANLKQLCRGVVR
ncbi:MAG: hypothetical protein IPL78_06375 [Chloroflexi bacterium]|nr:hypothetical protein [Chloroflexota bacterium]